MGQVTLSRGQVVRAHRDGAAAAVREGSTAQECPHDTTSSDPNARVLAAAWVRGYIKAGGTRSGSTPAP